MKISQNLKCSVAALLICALCPTRAHAATWTISSAIYSIAQEAENTMVIHLTTNPTTSCTDNNWLAVPETNTGRPTYKTLAPIITAAYLFGRPIKFNLEGCNSSGRPIVIGIISE